MYDICVEVKLRPEALAEAFLAAKKYGERQPARDMVDLAVMALVGKPIPPLSDLVYAAYCASRMIWEEEMADARLGDGPAI